MVGLVVADDVGEDGEWWVVDDDGALWVGGLGVVGSWPEGADDGGVGGDEVVIGGPLYEGFIYFGGG